jgi:hypothetical protein
MERREDGDLIIFILFVWCALTEKSVMEFQGISLLILMVTYICCI